MYVELIFALEQRIWESAYLSKEHLYNLYTTETIISDVYERAEHDPSYFTSKCLNFIVERLLIQ